MSSEIAEDRAYVYNMFDFTGEIERGEVEFDSEGVWFSTEAKALIDGQARTIMKEHKEGYFSDSPTRSNIIAAIALCDTVPFKAFDSPTDGGGRYQND